MASNGDLYVAQLFLGEISKVKAGKHKAKTYLKVALPAAVEATPTGLLATINAGADGPEAQGTGRHDHALTPTRSRHPPCEDLRRPASGILAGAELTALSRALESESSNLREDMHEQDPASVTAATVIADVADDQYDNDLIDLRRDLHAHPELSWSELRQRRFVAARVEQAGWQLTRYSRTGFAADLGTGGPLVALRADMDALPVQDLTDDPWASTVAGVAHACGHDVHTTALTGAALALAELMDRGLLSGRVRLLFQPAEEVMPGGALHLLEKGALDDVERVFALHCDPGVDVGQVGLRLGPLTSAADRIEVRLTGTGGHTSRPHLTSDLTFALAKVTTELPAVLSRRIDPRAGVSMVWGSLHAGSAANVIPDHGVVTGTVRILDAVALGRL